MGLRSPQEMKQTQIRPAEATRFRASTPTLSTQFIETASKGLSEASKLEQERKKKQFELTRATLKNDFDDMRMIAETEVSVVEGLNAEKVASQKAQKLSESMRERLEQLPEAYRPLLEQDARETMGKFRGFAIPHSFKQIKKVEDDTFKKRIANEANDAIENGGDLELFGNVGLKKVEAEIVALGVRQGQNPEQIQFNVQTGISDTIRRNIEAQATVGRLDLARETVTRFADRMLPADIVKAKKLIDRETSNELSRVALDLAELSMQATGGNLVEAEKYIRATTTSDAVYSRATAFLTRQGQIQREQQQRQEEAVRAQINKGWAEGKSAKELLPLIQQLPEDKQNELISRINTNNGKLVDTITDQSAWEELNDRLNSAPTGKDIPPHILDTYRDRISAKDMRTFEMKLSRLKRADSDEIARAQRANDPLVTEIALKFSEENRLPKSQRAMMYRLAQERYEQLIIENPRSTPAQIRTALRKELKENGITTIKQKKFGIFPDDRRVPNEGLVRDTTPTVHPSVREYFKRKNPNLTEGQVNELVQRAIDRGIDVSKPR